MNTGKRSIRPFVFVAVLGAVLISMVSVSALALEDLGVFAQSVGEPHTHDNITFTAWTNTTSLPSAEGNYYLTEDVTIGSTWNVPGGATKLCLNGHGIKMTGSGSVISVNSGATFNLYDCSETEHKFTVANAQSNGAGLATVNDALTSGYKTFTGGYITGATYSAFITSGSGSFIMNGGTIIGNSSTNYGAAVFMKDTSSFTMNGGSIEHNYTTHDGGAVESNSKCTLVINGGFIRYNVAAGFGGGIDTSAKTFIMNGGSITDNVSGSNGGGIDVWGGSLSISGSVDISGNTKGGVENNLCLWGSCKITIAGVISNDRPISVTLADGSGKTTSTPRVITNNWSTYMGDADPADYFTSDNKSYSAFLNDSGEAEIGIPPHIHDNVDFTAWTSTNSLPASAGNYYLSSDITISSTWTVPSGNTNLCLNGHSITYTGSSGSVFYVGSGCSLDIYECDATVHYYDINDETHLAENINTAYGNYSFVGGYITGGKGYSYGGGLRGGAAYIKGGTVNVHGGAIIGNKASSGEGGGFYIDYGTLTMSDGYIVGNYATSDGGGLQVSRNNSGYFYMTGGHIANNTAYSHGGGLTAYNVADISGGLITGNQCFGGNKTYYKEGGGAIQIEAQGKLSISGNTEISGNKSAMSGGGILVWGDCSYFRLSGNPVIKDNTAAYGGTTYTDDNIRLNSSKTINISGALSSAEPIGVSVSSSSNNISGTGVFTSDWHTHMDDTDPAKYFTSDNNSYKVFLNNNGEVEIAVPPVASVISGETTTSYGSFPDALNAWLNSSDGAILKLRQDVSYTDKIILSSNKKRVLDLNGKTFFRAVPSGDGTVFDVNSGANFTLKDTSEEQTGVVTRQSGNYGGTVLFVRDSGSVINFDGGKLTGFTSRVIIIWQGSTVNMSGGEISGNNLNNGDATDGIVRTYSSTSEAGGTFNMTGGKIINNTLGSGKTGGAVYVGNNGTFNISGNVEISGNTQNGKPKNVYLPAGKTMNVTGALTCDTPIAVTLQNGSGVFTNSSDTSYNDPSKFVSDSADYYVIKNKAGQLQLISVNTVASVTSGSTDNYYTSISDAISGWKSGGKLTLLKDASYSSVINIRPMYGYNAGEYTLDLNGKKFNIQSVQVGLNNSPNTLRTGPHLIIEDNKTGGILRFSESGMIDYGGLIELRGGTLTGGNGTWGGLFLLHIYASLDMYDGVTLTGNTSTYGGAVLVGSDSQFNMYGGKISGNSASDSGGGVVVFDNDAARFNMYGGEISGNRAPKGGGVSVNVGSFHICGNNAIIKDNVNGGSFSSETATYTGGTPNNIYLPSGKKINIDSELSSTPVGITLQNGSGVFTSGWKANMGTADPADYFVSDNADYEVRLENGEAVVNYPFVSGVTASGYRGNYDGASHSISVNVPEGANVSYGTKEGSYTLSSCPSYTAAGTYTVYYQVSKNKHTPVTGSATVTIHPIDVTVTITGHTATADYDGTEHTVSGYEAVFSTDLYTAADFTFSGTAEVKRTNAGTTNMGLAAEQFVNTNGNFATVTFNVTDGFVTVNPIDVTVTITGHNSTADYDATEHTVSGYEAAFSTNLYTAADFTFSGTAQAKRTNAGTTNMGLAAEQFANTNPNFATVTFNVTDGYIKVNPIDVTVTITGHNGTADYDGEAHTVTGYDVAIGNALYKEADFTFSGTASVERTDAGTTNMGLAANQFANTNSNFATVTFNVTDGYITINPIDVTVTITGHTATADYDGTEHTVSGYEAVFSTDLYTAADFTFSGTAEVKRTNAGTTNMGLAAGQFANTNSNFATVTFNVTDGYIKVDPINATVTIIGNNGTTDYDGKEHTVTGYTASADTDLYDVTNSFTFSGDAAVTETNAGTTNMGLAPEQFANTNSNFATVTFNVTDGYQTVNTVDAVITTAPSSTNPVYNGSDLGMVKAGTAVGGTLYYAINQDPKNAPADGSFKVAVPTAKETGSYYVWYKVKSDDNHNDLSPTAVRVILAQKDWVELNGTLYKNDGKTTIGDAVVTLMKGEQKVDYVITDQDGKYQFIVPAGVYSIVAEYQQNTQTTMVTLFADKTENTVMSGGNTQSHLQVNSNGGAFDVAVGGLDEEARSIRKDGNISGDTSVSVLMTVSSKTEATAQNAESISAFAKNKTLIFFDARVEKTVDSTTTVLNETTNVLEIAVPYAKVSKRGLAVYYADDAGMRTLAESTSKEEGTFSVDKENGIIYIYSSHFSTFAIGYTPYYQVSSSASLGSFQGTVTVTLINEDGAQVYKFENVSMDTIRFTDVPKGRYTMTVTWVDGAENTLTVPLTIGDNTTDAPEQNENTPVSVLASSFRQTDSFTPATSAGIKTSAPSGSPLTLAATTESAIGSDGIYANAFDAFEPKRFLFPVRGSKRESLRI